MHTSALLKLFPPPKFLVMRYAGLNISDDAIRFVEFGHNSRGLTISKYGSTDLPVGLIDGGDVQDEKKLTELLLEFDRTHDLSYVKVSIPEEKAYLFETEIPGPTDIRSIEQHIEFKLEENVPLSAADAVFYFDLIRPTKPGEPLRASVSVVPRSYIERYISMLRNAGIFPVAFEVAPRALTRAILPSDDAGTTLFVHIMNRKTGMYVVSKRVVSFTSTLSLSNTPGEDDLASRVANISREVGRIQAYWISKDAGAAISQVVIVGKNALSYEAPLESALSQINVHAHVADVWHNVFDVNHYIPPVSRESSFEYAVAAGLGIPE